jgi:hypothetical protein
MRADARDIRLKPWLFTIARNRCLSILRARREQPAELDDVPTVGLADEVQHRSDLRELLDDLRRLPVDQRAALVLSEVGDLSHSEVGAVVGCEVAKVKSLVFQARSSLIETRRARDIPCSEIREQLATATGGALRRGPLRRHLRACASAGRSPRSCPWCPRSGSRSARSPRSAPEAAVRAARRQAWAAAASRRSLRRALR